MDEDKDQDRDSLSVVEFNLARLMSQNAVV